MYYWFVQTKQAEKNPSQSSFLSWLMQQNIGQPSSFLEHVDPSYYRIMQDNQPVQYRYSRLDSDFLKILFMLKKYLIQVPHVKQMLHPSCFVALIQNHPCFAYSIERYWNFYSNYKGTPHDYTTSDWKRWAAQTLSQGADRKKIDTFLRKLSQEQCNLFGPSPYELKKEPLHSRYLQKDIDSADLAQIQKILCKYDEYPMSSISSEPSHARKANHGAALYEMLIQKLQLNHLAQTNPESYYFPSQLSVSPCVRMFFRKLQVDIWESSSEHTILNAHFYIGSSAIAKLVSDQYQELVHAISNYFETQRMQNPYTFSPIPWTQPLLYDSEDFPTSQFSGHALPFLSQLMAYFYDSACITDWIQTCRRVKVEWNEQEALSSISDLATIESALHDFNQDFLQFKNIYILKMQDFLVQYMAKYHTFLHSYEQYQNTDSITDAAQRDALANDAFQLDTLTTAIHHTNQRILHHLRETMDFCTSFSDFLQDEQYQVPTASFADFYQTTDSQNPISADAAFSCASLDANHPLYDFIQSLPEWFHSPTRRPSLDALLHTTQDIQQAGNAFWNMLSSKSFLHPKDICAEYDAWLSSAFGIKTKAQQTKI